MTDALSLNDIWPQYQSRLRAFLRKRLANAADVDDVLQEISIKVLNGLPQLAEHSKLQPWLFQTAQHAVVDHYRRSKKGSALHPDDLWYGAEEPEVRRELEHCIEPFIDALPAETAQLLRAVDLEGQAQKSVAADLGLPYSTLKSRVQQGRTDLRKLYEDCCTLRRDSRGLIADYDPKPETCKKC